MKIVSWNCNGKFREKFSILQKLDADIYVVQECGNRRRERTALIGKNGKVIIQTAATGKSVAAACLAFKN